MVLVAGVMLKVADLGTHGEGIISRDLAGRAGGLAGKKPPTIPSLPAAEASREWS